MDVFKLTVALLTLKLVKVDGAVSSPEDIEACVGEDITIPWRYDDIDSDISTVVWSVNGTTNIMTYFGSGGSRTPQGGYNVVAANNEGSINITNAQRSNTGTYKIDISALLPSSDDVDLLVCKPASKIFNGTKGNDFVMQCTASDLGEPEAQLYIKVNGEAKSSSSATVKDGDEVECCISGCAAKCIGSGNEYCTTVQNCTCECKCKCTKMAIASIVIGIVGAIILVFVVVGSVKECFGRKTALVVDSIGIVFGVISFVLGIVVQGCCKASDCCKDSDCCEDECERNWVENIAVLFIVIGGLVGIAGGVIFYLIWSGKIGPGNNAYNAKEPGENHGMTGTSM